MSVIPTSLRSRFVILIGAVLTIVGLLGYEFVQWYGDRITNQLSIGYAERSALYEKSRIVNVLVREVTLAQKMASSPGLKDWLSDEENVRERDAVFSELEDYRSFFRSQSYFVTVAKSGHYYYNDKLGGHPIGVPRYSVDRDIQKDGWFFTLLESGEPQRLNVDTDRGVGVTNVWVNIVVRDAAGKAIAVTGTGIDLSEFIHDLISSDRPGITNAFIDLGGAIQAHPDMAIIDFASLRKEASQEEQSTIFSLIDSSADTARLREAMAALAAGHAEVKALNISVQRRPQFVGISYVPEIKWFVMTFVDQRQMAQEPNTPAVGLLLVGVFLGVLLIVALLVDFFVLRRLGGLAAAIGTIGEGRYDLAITESSPDEIGHLARTLRHMADRIGAHTDDLERQVRERTRDLVAANAQLKALAATDTLTGAWNRRRLEEAVINEMDRLTRYGHPASLLIIDIDLFKNVNDHFGHATGDHLLCDLVAVVQSTLRASDSLTRWGGEEFIVLCPNTTLSTMTTLAERLREKIAQTAFRTVGNITVSLGVAECLSGETWEQWFQRADAALYRAKACGRNQVQVATGASPRTGAIPSADFVHLTWSTTYECGHTGIDVQHRQLFGHANNLLAATLSGRPTAELAGLIDPLIRDVVQHFQDEEAVITAAGFPGAAQHAALHRELLNHAAELVDHFHAGGLNVGDLFQFLADDVIAHHLLGADREYFSYLVAEQGTEPSVTPTLA